MTIHILHQQQSVKKQKANIRRRVCGNLENPRKIVTTEVQNVSETVRMNLPELQPEYQITSEGERFLIHDSGIDNQKRILIFGTRYILLIGLEIGHSRSTQEFFSWSTHFTVWFKIVLYLTFMFF